MRLLTVATAIIVSVTVSSRSAFGATVDTWAQHPSCDTATLANFAATYQTANEVPAHNARRLSYIARDAHQCGIEPHTDPRLTWRWLLLSSLAYGAFIRVSANNGDSASYDWGSRGLKSVLTLLVADPRTPSDIREHARATLGLRS